MTIFLTVTMLIAAVLAGALSLLLVLFLAGNSKRFPLGKKFPIQLVLISDTDLLDKFNRLFGILKQLRRDYVAELNAVSSLQEANEIMYSAGRRDLIKELSKSMMEDHEKLYIEPVSLQSSGNFEKIVKKKFTNINSEEKILSNT